MSHRLATLRELVEDHDVQIAVVGEGEAPRDGRGRHDQHVRLPALALERHPLMQPEPVLFVDDRERQVVEGHALLHQRMGTDHEVDVARSDPLEDPDPVLARHR